MAYNPNYYYPAGYQPMQYQQPIIPNRSNPDTGINWVQGEAGAKAFPVGAGQSAVLMDTEDTLLYVKTVDQSGMPQPLRTFRLSEITGSNRSSKAVAENTETVSREEFEALREEVMRLSKGVRKPAAKEKDGEKDG